MNFCFGGTVFADPAEKLSTQQLECKLFEIGLDDSCITKNVTENWFLIKLTGECETYYIASWLRLYARYSLGQILLIEN